MYSSCPCVLGKKQNDENSNSGSRTSLNKHDEISMNSKSNGRNNERDNSHYSLSRDGNNAHKSKNNNNNGNNHSQKMKEHVFSKKSNPNSINGNNKVRNFLILFRDFVSGVLLEKYNL